MIDHRSTAPKHIKYLGGFLLAAIVAATLWLHMDGDANDRKRLQECYDMLRIKETGR